MSELMAANKLFTVGRGYGIIRTNLIFFLFHFRTGAVATFCGTEKPAPVRTDLQMILTLTCIVFISYR